MWPDDRDRIDIAIDGIAREMVGPAPRAGFTARVLTRISAPRSARRAGRVVSPVALAALVVVGVAVYGIRELTSPRLVQPPVPERHAGSPARSSREEVKPEIERAAGRAAPRPAAARPPALPRAPIRASDIDALAPPALSVVSIALGRLDRPESIVLQQLDIESIVLSPLDQGDRP